MLWARMPCEHPALPQNGIGARLIGWVVTAPVVMAPLLVMETVPPLPAFEPRPPKLTTLTENPPDPPPPPHAVGHDADRVGPGCREAARVDDREVAAIAALTARATRIVELKELPP